MGSKNSKTKESILVNRLILDSYQNTELELPESELNKMKIRFKEAESYFRLKFDYLLFFNNDIFHDGLSTLYDNYINQVEKFSSKNYKKIRKEFTIFVDFFPEDDEGGYLDLEFEPLFIVIFEKLEILSMVCFYLSFMNNDYIRYFFEQLYENVYFYKDNRNFDSLYFLLPGSDFVVKNDNYIIYISGAKNKSNQISQLFNSVNINETHNIALKGNYHDIFFNTPHFSEFLNYKSTKKYSDTIINNFIQQIPFSEFIKYIIKINFDDSDKLNFINKNQKIIDQNRLLFAKTPITQIYLITESILSDGDNYYNFTNLIKSLIINCNNASSKYATIIVKIIQKNNLNKNITKINTTLSLLDKYILMLLHLSFPENKNNSRKICIEYYNIYKIEKPTNDIKKNIKDKIEKLASNACHNVVNNLDVEGADEEDLKENTHFYYNNENLYYEWFLNNENMINIIICILYCIDNEVKKIRKKIMCSHKEGKNNDIRIKKSIFRYLFDLDTIKYYFCKYTTKTDQKISQKNFETQIFN